jgi:hypothetical protein
MKAVTLRALLLSTTLLFAVPAQAGDWFVCGNLLEIGWSCQLANYPSTHYEYGVAYNAREPHPVTCSYWNYGMRIYNKLPYFVSSDNPQTGSFWGGFILYTGTLATDDDTCSGGTWRHQYWHLDANNAAKAYYSNGCLGGLAIYCRAR